MAPQGITSNNTINYGDRTSSLTTGTLGIRISYLKTFISLIGGRGTIENYTTQQIVDTYLKPMTNSNPTVSFTEQLSLNGGGETGQATWYISHRWSYNFLSCIDAVLQWFKDHDTDTKQTFVWMDIFCEPQHGSNRNRGTEWFMNTFPSFIENTGNMLQVILPWYKPLIVRRSWGCWEIYVAAITKCRYEVATLAYHREEKREDGMARLVKTLFDMKNGTLEAANPNDQLSIDLCIEREVGKDGLRSTVYEMVVEGVQRNLKEAADLLSRKGKLEKALTVRNHLLFYHKDVKDYVKLVELLRENLRDSISLYGEDDEKTIETRNYLAGNLYARVGGEDNIIEAEQLFLKSFYGARNAYGEGSPRALAAADLLAEIYESEGRHNDKIAIMEYLLSQKVATVGRYHVEVLGFMNLVVRAMLDANDLDEAENEISLNVDDATKCLGEEHPVTVEAMHCMAMTLSRIGSFARAITYLERVCEIRRQPSNLTTGSADLLESLGLMGKTYLEMGEFTSAEVTFLEFLNISKLHPDGINQSEAIVVHRDLAAVYEAQYNLPEATHQLQTFLVLGKNLLPPNHPNLLRTYRDLVRVLMLRRKMVEIGKVVTKYFKQFEVVGGGGPKRTTEELLDLLLGWDDASYKTFIGPKISTMMSRSDFASFLTTIASQSIKSPI
ncbi:Kinesin light chain 3 [Phlyctochytrium planicorne]|nr:Kinesin light chain 3 [Phlyctochytrium planicorne]